MLTQTMMPNRSSDFDTQKIFAAINQASSIHDLQKIVNYPRLAICYPTNPKQICHVLSILKNSILKS
jgi:hypothetical protein